MKTRYTAVFEFDGEEPLVKISDGWHGGKLIRVGICAVTILGVFLYWFFGKVM